MKNKIKEKKVSIIIRTKNEEQWIEICIRKINEQTYSNKEIILIDNYSTDKTLEKIKNANVKIIKIKKFLPGKAINLGIKKSTGEYIVCLSAHCIPVDKNWLKNIVKDLSKKKVAAIYGRQLPFPYSSSLDKRDLYNSFGLEKRVQKKDTFFHNANSAFHKRIWQQFPFDEKIQHIEDRIWANKIIKNRYKIIYEPKAAVFHWHGINQAMDQKRCDEIVKILEELDTYKNDSTDLIKFKNLKCAAILPIKEKSLMIEKKLSLLKTSINHLKQSSLINEIYLDTSNGENLKTAKELSIKTPFLRNIHQSNFYIDIISEVKNFVLKLEQKNKFYDLIVILTENFPFRPIKIFDEMIKLIIKGNYDAVLATQKLKGSLFLNNNSEIKNVIDGTIPKEINKQAILSRIGVGCVIRANKLRTGKILNGKIGFYNINNPMSFIEIDKNNVNQFNLRHFQNFSELKFKS